MTTSLPQNDRSPDEVVRAAGRNVPTRRMAFEETFADIPKHFAVDHDLILSHLAASLSAVFPDGEDFFVRSVRHYRNEIDDPELKRDVAGFIGQEAMHGREHRAFNDRLDELGYPTKRFERLTKWGLTTREKIAPPINNLAVTAALEHFTATLAELLLTNEEVRDLFGDEAVRDLFVWHALEESEHKAVAFDVYRAVGGSERMRRWTMNFIFVGFFGGMTLQIIDSLLHDRSTRKKGRLRESWRRFKRSPLADREILRTLRSYNRPGFHPDDHDNSELVAEWRERLFGDDGSLNDKLVGAAA
jgi:uncharacterized protein